jgi:hypothetical protein
MKKNNLSFSGLIVLLTLVLFACQKKSDGSATTPGFKEENGTGGNPFPNNPTVTGTPTSTNPATQNSSLLVGGIGWSNPTCASTFSVTLKGINGTIDVTLNFLTPPITGTYVIAAVASQSQACSMTVLNAPNQPAGTVWLGKSGLVAVNTTSTAINASFSGVICTQQSFNFPQVSVSGNLGCN